VALDRSTFDAQAIVRQLDVAQDGGFGFTVDDRPKLTHVGQ
jgi:hypothetical protein